MATELEYINMESRARLLGYPLESYKVITDDGYVLTLFRMVSSKKCNMSDIEIRKKPILVQHGLLVSSTSWLLSEANNSLPCLLADACYDVWLGNFRGTNYSRLHTKFGSNSREFWDFSWHEMGIYDLPAMIDFILKVTRFKSLHYVGHSQGTTTFFVMASTRPKYNSKITSMHALAPVAYIGNLVSPILRILGPMVGQPSLIFELLGDMLVVPSSRLLALMGYEACKKSSPLESICSNLMFLFVGYDTENFNKTLIPDIIATSVNAGASAKQLIHYGQIIASHKFREYDHGTVRNLFHYAQSTAPEYNISKITAPVYIYFGNNDWLTSIEDIRRLAVRLPNLKSAYRVPYARFNHLDFMFAENVTELVYNAVLKNLKRYE
ncbi:lipase 3-like [Condylostylus longicornis]|uniref:lipase 3-like n=1 Tax=Condylostylus longicornis TaxID=2530218 RepID=UPI00244E2179|nr:lipase 3-like [Condylostylus longicornis]